jgi:metal-responsive CopG/Arc/MetJ family transcriptional regulator
MPRPKLNRERLNVTMPKDLLSRLDSYSAREAKDRSRVIEEAVEAFLDREDRKRPSPARK